ncbi:hypothetical protein Tco_0717399 [Tanacetum coccineum]
MSKPLPLQDKEGRLIIPVEFYFNNDLEYLKARNKDRTYSSSITKTPAARYTMEGIEDMIMTLWSPVIIAYDKEVALGISHWGPQRQQYGYGYLKEIVVRRADQKLYKFKECDFPNLHLNDIEDMLLLISQNKLFNLDGDVIMDFVTALKMFTRGIIVKNRIEDVQLDMLLREWTTKDKKCIGIMLNKIDDLLFKIRVLRSLEVLVGGRKIEMDKRLLQRTNWRDLPRDIPLDRIEVLRYDTKGVKVRKGKMQTERELTLEQTHQGVSDEVLVSIEGVEE